MPCWAALGVAAASLAFSTLPAARPQCVRHLGAPAAPVAMAAVGGDADEGGETYEVTLAKPLGMQLAEQEAGVVVSMVYETGNAADGGVRVGDVVLATSASVGPQMWEKRTLAGVESAIRTRVDGQVRLRLRRPADKRELAWDAPLQCTYEVELSRPLGLVLRLAAAEQLGTDGVKPDVQVYTTLVKAHAACGQRAEALAVLPRMSAEQVAPSVKTYNTLMSVCARAADRRGMLAHFAMLQQAGLRPTAASFNVLLGYCAREGDAAQATALLERMRGAGVPPDVISYSCAMQAHVARADVAAASALLRPLRDDGLAPDVRMLNTLLGGHAQLKQWAPAFALLRSFEEEDGVRPDALSYSLLLRACVRAKAADQAESALRLMHRAGVAPTVRSYAMVMSARAQPGGLAAVLRLLREMQAAGLAPDRYAFSALMEACVLNGRPETALAVYDQMLEQGVPADGVTRTLRLRALCAPPASAGALRAAFAGLEEMRADETGACEPNAVAYNAVLEGCVQAGDAERALAALRMLLDGRCSPNRATQGLIARFGVAPPGAPRRGERGKPTPRPRAATRRFLLEVLDLFEARGRRLNGDVYLALLRACEAEPEAAARVVSRRRAFDLRRAQLAEADELEEHLARTPVQPKK